jgi:hypothetical protein
MNLYGERKQPFAIFLLRDILGRTFDLEVGEQC